jgi:hypothetical protein
VSEDMPSADSTAAPAAPTTPAPTGAPEAMSIPRQSTGDAALTSGAAAAQPATPPAAASTAVKTEPLAPKVPAADPTEATPAESAAVDAPAKKKRGLLAGAIIAVIVLILLAVVGVLLYQKVYADPTKDAVAGTCLADLPIVAVGEDKEATKARIVECTDSAATHQVEARVNNQTEAQAKSPDVCKDFPDSTFIYRAVPGGGTGYVLCLKPLAK